MRIFLCFILCAFALSAAPVLSSADTPKAETTPIGIHFTADTTLYYDYLNTSIITQNINDDTIVIHSEIAWRFALRCAASDTSGADLVLTIQILKAKMTDPAVSYEVNSSNQIPPSKQNILRHFLLLNGKSFNIRYNYATQGIESISGGAAIIAAIRKEFPDDDFGSTHRVTQQAEQQFSDASLLRLWSRILLGARSGNEIIELGNPLNRSVTRNWGAIDDNSHPYTLQLAGVQKEPKESEADSTKDASAKGRILNTGANGIEVQIDTLSGSGFVHIVDQALIASSQSIEAKITYTALTQNVTQNVAMTWKLVQIDAPAWVSGQKQDIKAVDDGKTDGRMRPQE